MAETLREYLRTADVIEDDAEFCEVEHDMAYEYCRERNFNLNNEDMETIRARGLDESFEYWKNNYLCDQEPVVIEFPIYCFERELTIKVCPEEAVDVLKIMQEAYDTWVSDEDAVGSSCCEEYILECVKSKGYWYKLIEENVEDEE